MNNRIPEQIAAIDVGTNSFHLVVASVNSRGMLLVHEREKENVRLGSSTIKDMRHLEPDAMERGVNAMMHFAKIARSSNAKIIAVATSAVREAENKTDFIERVRELTGVNISVISGVEEGRLIYEGVIHALPVFSKNTLVIDIGGGSTETIIGNGGEVKFVHSTKIGAIRISNNFFPDYETTSERIRACREYIKGLWTPILSRISEDGFDVVVGTSGTIASLVAISKAMNGKKIPDVMNGCSATRHDLLRAISKILHTKTVAERMKIPGMDAVRADIILGGSIILESALRYLNIDQVIISGYALREGVVFDYMNKGQSGNQNYALVNLRFETILNLCARYKVEMSHAEHVRDISLQLFDGLQSLHGLKSEERELLAAAAMLHDVGYFISHDQHHKHSYYVISQSVMPGFDNLETQIIALITRYHRKGMPKEKHLEYKELQEDKRYGVCLMAGILRIAEGMDRRQIQLIAEVKTEIKDKKVTLQLTRQPDKTNILPDIELWGAERRTDLLTATLHKKIEIRLGTPDVSQ